MVDDFEPSAPHWPAPTYSLGPLEYVHAIGAASANFCLLEESLYKLFNCTVLHSLDVAPYIFAKLSNDARIDSIRLTLKRVDANCDYAIHVNYFLDGYSICAKNRNTLMHSQYLAPIIRELPGVSILFKKSRSGGQLVYSSNLESLRKVADDIRAFADYGRALGVYIGVTYSSIPNVRVSLPEKPGLPSLLNEEPQNY